MNSNHLRQALGSHELNNQSLDRNEIDAEEGYMEQEPQFRRITCTNCEGYTTKFIGLLIILLLFLLYAVFRRYIVHS